MRVSLDLFSGRPIALPDSSGGGGGASDTGLDTAEFLASADIPKLSLVTLSGLIANSNTMAHFNRVLGIVMDDVANGFIGTAIVEGEVDDPSWTWTPGSKLFLNGTALSLLAPTSGFSQMIAIVRTDTKIFVRLQPPIFL